MSSSDSENDESMRELLAECVDKQFSATHQPSTLEKVGPTDNKNQNSAKKHKSTVAINRPSKRPQRVENTDDDNCVPAGMKAYLAKQLDQLISKTYEFVDMSKSETTEREPLETPEVDHCVSVYNITSGQVNDKQDNVQSHQDSLESCPKIRKPWKVHSKLDYEKVDEEELRRLAVSGEWVLNKCGVYGNGGERRSELVTGAVHSPAIKKYK